MEKIEKLYSDVIQNSDNFYNEELVKKLLEMTKKIAIDFSLWQQMGECVWICTDEDHWVNPFTKDTSITTEELFNEFLKTYEL